MNHPIDRSGDDRRELPHALRLRRCEQVGRQRRQRVGEKHPEDVADQQIRVAVAADGRAGAPCHHKFGNGPLCLLGERAEQSGFALPGLAGDEHKPAVAATHCV